MRLSWVQPEDLVAHAFVQARQDGVDVEALERQWVSAGGQLDPPVSGTGSVPATPALRRAARTLLDAIDSLAVPEEGFPADRLDAIRARSGRPVSLPTAGHEALLDRIHGAWLGRCAGCLLGKPVEKIPREGIEAILRSTGDWPLSTYFTAHGLDPQTAARWPWNRRSALTSLRENIDGMPEDDDLNFAVLALRMLHQHGYGLTTDDVAQTWLASVPGGRVFTAERVAYRNLLLGHPPERAALVHNPFREWIGALIRTDVYGWARPGNLAEASRVAWADARLTHTGAGLHGALWAAALASAAVTAGSVDEALAASMSVIPADSPLAAAVEHGITVGKEDTDWTEALDQLHAAYGHLHWVHVLNNAAAIAFALARGAGDFGTSVSLAVMCGWDTDSAGATVGGVVGGRVGAAALPAEWTEPLDNRLQTSLPGPPELVIDRLAELTFDLALDRS